MSLARQMELREQYTAAAAPQGRHAPRAPLPAQAQRLAVTAGPAAKLATPATVNVEGRQIKRLSATEQEERRRLGLCYN